MLPKTGKQFTNKGSHGQGRNKDVMPGYKPKDLMGIPWRVAFALQADGWFLRSAAPWIKGSAMPGSQTDRDTVAHEYIFQLTKSGETQFWVHRDGGGTRTKPAPDYRWIHRATGEEVTIMPEDWDRDKAVKKQWKRQNLWRGHNYWFDIDAVRLPAKEVSVARAARGLSDHHKLVNGAGGQTPHSMNQPRPNLKQDAVGKRTYTGFNARYAESPVALRTRRTSDTFYEMLDEQIAHLQYVRDHGGALVDGDSIAAFLINPKGFSKAHFATFPISLVTPMLLATCPPQVCAVCGAPYVRIIEKSEAPHDGPTSSLYPEGSNGNRISLMRQAARERGGEYVSERRTVGWSPTCDCDGGTDAGIVLDPFMGAGTTGVTAVHHDRHYVGIELNPDYVQMAEARIRDYDPLQPEEDEETGVIQHSLFEEIDL